MNINIPIYIATSNNFLPLLKPFAYLFNKHWSPDQEVNFLGYDLPDFKLPENFNFISLGKQLGVKHWSNDIIKFFNSIEDTHFIYTAEDQFIIDFIDENILNNLLKFTEDDNVGKICLNHGAVENSHFIIDTIDYFNIIELNQDANWRNSLQWSIWNKSYFFKYLNNDMSQWDFELMSLESNSPVKNDEVRILGTSKQYVINNCNAVKTAGDVSKFDFKNLNFSSIVSKWSDGSLIDTLDNNILNELIEEGLING